MSVDPMAFRQVMSRLPTGVTVLTAAAPGRHEVMTANAVISVSLDPVLLLASVRSDCRWRAAVAGSGRFAVNVLGADQEELSRWCASSQRHAFPERVLDHPTRTTAGGVLVFTDALAAFDCTVHAEYVAGDHHLVVGRVVDMHVSDAHDPLVFFDSRYTTVAPPPAAWTLDDGIAVAASRGR